MCLFSAKRCPDDLFGFHFTHAFNKCRPTYSPSDEDRTAFNLPGWIPIIHHSQSRPTNELCPEPWKYQQKGKTLSLSHPGKVNTYDGGGYIASLGYNKQSASDIVRDLKEHNWIDESTAAVFIEFTLFNPSTSLFSFARHTYERLPTGQAVAESAVKTLLLYRSTNTNLQSFKEACLIIFLVFIVVCFIAEMVKFVLQKNYLRQVWNWVELLLLLVSFVAIAMSFLKAQYTSLYVKKVKQNPFETVSSDYIVWWSEQEILWFSAGIFILTIKLLRLVRFNHHICQMQGTLKRSVRPFISFVFVFGIGIMAFTYFGCIGFGTHAYIFSSLYKSFSTNMLMSIGKQINYVEIYLVNSLIQPVFLFFYFLFILCMMINVFIAVITDSYTEVREDHGDSFEDAKLGGFMFVNFSNKVKQFPSEVISGIKRLSKLRCTDLAMGKKPYKFKLRKGRKRHWNDEDAICVNGSRKYNESHELVPLRTIDDLSDVFREERTTIGYKTGADITLLRDAIDDYYLTEIRKQLFGALAELSRYYVSIERDSKTVTGILHPEGGKQVSLS